MLLPVVVPVWALGRADPLPWQGEPLSLQVCAVDDPPLPELLVGLSAEALPLGASTGASTARHPVRLHVDGASLHYESATPLHGPVHVRVGLQDGSTGFAHPDTPALTGTVTRVRLLSVWVTWDEQRQTYARSGRFRLEPLEDWPYEHRLEPANPDGAEPAFWEPDALVVDLEL